MTLIEVIVASALMALVFVGIVGIFKSSIELTQYTKTKIGALALANDAIEYTRSLSYDDVGVVSGIPSGVLPQTEVINANGIDYTRRMVVLYIDDPADGIGTSDENNIASDYKKIKAEVSWEIKGVTHEIEQVTNIVPNGIETLAGGGTLIINVFDATALPVENADVRVVNASTTPTIDVTLSTNADGKVWFPGSPAIGNYEVTVSKSGYSTAQTYDKTATNVVPDPGHQSVLAAQTTQVSFAIDVLGSKLISTFEPVGPFTWDDLFADTSKISVTSSTTVTGGQLQLIDDASVYRTPGTVQAIGATHGDLVTWESISWNDTLPANTEILYQLYYDNSGWVLVPDVDVPGNSAGFAASATSSIDISGLATTTYTSLALVASLTTTDTAVTPSIQDWQIDYTAGPIALGSVDFHMRGAKEIGEDATPDPIFKYDANLSTDAGGTHHVDPIEWDVYTITVDDGAIGYDISRICPPQPYAMIPGEDATTDIHLVADTNHTLLVTTKDSAGATVNDATVRLFKTGYDETQSTAGCGQTFFSALSSGEYDIEAFSAGHPLTTVEDIDVDGSDGADEVVVILND
jgi:hypothetical protein